jgi:hypothetical protein
MAETMNYAGTDGLSQMLAGNKAFGTAEGSGGAVNPWAAGGAAFGLGFLQNRNAKDALAGSGQVNLETMSPVGRMQMDELLKMLGGNAGNIQQGFSKGAAQQDAMGMVQQIFDNYQKTALPTIFNAQTGAGAYNSTGGQLLANDAYAQTVNKAAGTVNRNVLDYAQAYQQQMSPLVQLLGIDKGSRTMGSDTRGQGAQAMAAAATGQGAMASGLGTIGSAAGTALGGPVGGAIGGALGSILGGLF